MIVVFIAGGSASGKTELTKQILKKIKAFDTTCLALKMDDYYKEIPDGINIDKYKETTNFDDLDCLDLKLLQEHIIGLAEGNHINKPIFDFNLERRVHVETIMPTEILLIEGTFALYFANRFFPNLAATFKIFIEANHDTLLKRRIMRDLIERGYADENSIIKKDTEYVRPTFMKSVEPTKAFADVLISNDETFDFNIQPNPFISWAEQIVVMLRTQENSFLEMGKDCPNHDLCFNCMQSSSSRATRRIS
jgi:uridine kinase